jgi:uncharacterized membrane-anchored protein
MNVKVIPRIPRLGDTFLRCLQVIGLLLVVPLVGLPLLWLLDATVGEVAATVIFGLIGGTLMSVLMYRTVREDAPAEGRRRSLFKTAGLMAYLAVTFTVIVTLLVLISPGPE